MIGVEVTTVEWSDCGVFEGLLDQIEGWIGQVDGDGAYDICGVYEAGMARDAAVVVPPRGNAVPWEEGHPRMQALADIVGSPCRAGSKRRVTTVGAWSRTPSTVSSNCSGIAWPRGSSKGR
ncbi:hypothetical protein [Methylomagnum ishizawai]|uniref:hypothetical protein n=1 Tax=Methylomagnum ishizawai TaxID=1760988 RepID=UPI000A1664CD